MIIVEESIDWRIGDEIIISPSEGNSKEFDILKIAKIIKRNYIILDKSVKYFHYGSETIT